MWPEVTLEHPGNTFLLVGKSNGRNAIEASLKFMTIWPIEEKFWKFFLMFEVSDF